MRRIISIFILSILILGKTLATHNRAGEITYKQLSDLTYELTITTFTYVLSQADRQSLDVIWGDNSTSTAIRILRQQLPNYYQKNIYK